MPPDAYDDEPGTDHKWLKMTIEKEWNEELNGKEATIKKINYKKMNEILSTVQCKYQDVQEDTHKTETLESVN